jgi:hypothetical protein
MAVPGMAKAHTTPDPPRTWTSSTTR